MPTPIPGDEGHALVEGDLGTGLAKRPGRRPRAGASGAASRREEILAAAATIFARRGIANTTVRDIGEEAGILSGSLYHHFTSKDEMVEEIIRAALDPDIERDEALAHSDVDPIEAVRQLFDRGLRFSSEHPAVATIIADNRQELGAERFDFLRKQFDTIRRAWVAMLERGVRSGAFRPDLDVDLAYKAAMGAISSVPHWYRPDGARTIDEIIHQVTELFLRGFGAEG
jgi:TetR/AcrR family transcriptional regulator, cholesterol catabolism regulator